MSLRIVGLIVLAAAVLWQAPSLASDAYLNLGSMGLVRVANQVGCPPFSLNACPTSVNPANAAHQLAKAVSLNPNARETRLQLARLDLISNNVRAARLDLGGELTQESDPSLVLLAQGVTLWRAGQSKEAVAAWRAANAAPFVGRAGDRALSARQYRQAEQLYHAALEVNPTSGKLWSSLAQAQEKIGDNQAAITSLDTAFNDGLADSAAADRLGRLLAGQKRYAEAITWYDRALALQPNYYPYLLDVAGAYQAEGNPQAAEATYRAAVAAAPSAGGVHVAFAQFLLNQGSVDAAIAEARTGVSLWPDYGSGWILLGDAYLNQMHDPRAAAQALRKAVVIDPRYVPARIDLARALLESGDRVGARAQLALALQIDPTNATARSMLANIRP